MNDELLNTPLYHHLCTSVQNWFEKVYGNGVSYYHIFKFGNGKTFSLSNVWIGSKRRNIKLDVTICSAERICEHFEVFLSLRFNDKLQAEHDVELRQNILGVINSIYNLGRADDVVIYYNDLVDEISISKQLYFYLGAMPPEEEIYKHIDDFLYRDYVNQIAEIIEHHAWHDPLPYLIESLRHELDEEKQAPDDPPVLVKPLGT